MLSPEWLGHPLNNFGYKLKPKPLRLVLEALGFCLECCDFNASTLNFNFTKPSVIINAIIALVYFNPK